MRRGFQVPPRTHSRHHAIAEMNGLRNTLSTLMKSAGKRPGAPSAYILFSKAERGRLPPGMSSTPTQALRELARRWKEASPEVKSQYASLSAIEKSKISPVSIADPFPAKLVVKSAAQLDALTKKISESAVQSFFEDIQGRAAEEESVKVKGVGTVRPQVNEKGVLTLTVVPKRKNKQK